MKQKTSLPQELRFWNFSLSPFDNNWQPKALSPGLIYKASFLLITNYFSQLNIKILSVRWKLRANRNALIVQIFYPRWVLYSDMICCGSSGENCAIATEKYLKTANNKHVVVLKCEQLCDILSLRKSRQNFSCSSFCVGMFKGYEFFSLFSYALLLPSFAGIPLFSPSSFVFHF